MWVRIPPAAPEPRVVHSVVCAADPPDATACLDAPALGSAFAYLMGMYLGDGMLTLAAKRIWRLRIVLDQRYPLIIEQCVAAMEYVSGNKAGRVQKVGCIELFSNWKHWPCAFPQHGPGPKHLRSIELASWQEDLVRAYPKSFLTGLIHSDGCRAINRVRRPLLGGVKSYEYPRYFLSNASSQIRAMFAKTCARLGLRTGPANWRNLTVARSRDVAFLDTFIGPKR